jgi:putative ABC transport system ATP-binding protein
VIEIEGLAFRYPEGEFSLRVDRLTVEPGESVAIIGPSGCGKTTLLHLMAGIRRPSRGSISIGEARLDRFDEGGRRDFRIRRIGLVFQEFELLEYLTVEGNILLPFRINGALELTSEIRERARRLAREMGIGEHLDRFVHRLSQGERQRVAVCRALLADPELILADEPTGNLDPGNKGRVLDLLLGYARRRGATLVTVTHDHDLLPRFERVIDFKEFLAESAGGDGVAGPGGGSEARAEETAP